mgnify:CR=1 FL=1
MIKSVPTDKMKEQMKTDTIWKYMTSVDSPFHLFDGEWKLKYKDGVMTIRLEDK